MKIIDLTHYISEDMPVYPGTDTPKLQEANTYEKDGFKETLMIMYTHTGTHMDPPAHIFKGKTTLDQFPIEQFIGKAIVVDCSDLKEGDKIQMKHINRDLADKAEFLLFYTGWDKYWGNDMYFGDYPYIDDDVIQYIISQNKKGVGLDTIGIDPIDDENLTIHKRLFANNEIIIVENLMNLDKIGMELFTFIALPLKHKDADGSPIRAVAILEE